MLRFYTPSFLPALKLANIASSLTPKFAPAARYIHSCAGAAAVDSCGAAFEAEPAGRGRRGGGVKLQALMRSAHRLGWGRLNVPNKCHLQSQSPRLHFSAL